MPPDLVILGRPVTSTPVGPQPVLRGEGDRLVDALANPVLTCWFALTQGRYRQVIEAARAGRAMAPNEAVSVQLAGQEAKAWARMGDRRQVELALERGRVLLESLPCPDNLDNHFTVDPDKFDFYAMDCHRRVGEDAMATMHAHEVIRTGTAPDGSLRSPMRAAEAHTSERSGSRLQARAPRKAHW